MKLTDQDKDLVAIVHFLAYGKAVKGSLKEPGFSLREVLQVLEKPLERYDGSSLTELIKSGQGTKVLNEIKTYINKQEA